MSEPQLRIECSSAADGWSCRVTVGDDAGATTHEIGVTRDALTRYAPGADDPSVLIEESFRFMLEREPREAILRRFELPVIEHYFPDYPTQIERRMGRAG